VGEGREIPVRYTSMLFSISFFFVEIGDTRLSSLRSSTAPFWALGAHTLVRRFDEDHLVRKSGAVVVSFQSVSRQSCSRSGPSGS
jgi:hypothetical protein